MATPKKTAAQTVTPLERALAELADARALVAQRETEQTEAEQREATLIARLERGDESVAADELTGAGNAAKRASLLLTAARRALAVAERAADKARAQGDPVLALHVREAVAADPFGLSVYAFPVEVVAELPKEPATPAVLLWQVQATKFDYVLGLASGEARLAVVLPKGVEVQYHHMESFTTTLAKALGDDGTGRSKVNAKQQGLPLSSVSGFVVSVRFSALELPVPFVQENVPDYLLRNVGRGFRPVSQSREGDTVSRVFELTRTQFARQGDTLDDVKRGVYRWNAERVGKFVSGVGRVTAASVVQVDPVTTGIRANGYEVTERVTVTARVPHAI